MEEHEIIWKYNTLEKIYILIFKEAEIFNNPLNISIYFTVYAENYL